MTVQHGQNEEWANHPPRIILFLKAPRRGGVKTRLAKVFGNERALRIYRALAEQQVRALPSGWPAEICFDPPDAGQEMRDWLGGRFSYRAQVGGDLGDRMANAVQSAFEEGESSVLCIGADCPGLGLTELMEAERMLNGKNDLVFGPARDGGYYLLGMKGYYPEVFAEIPWSASNTLEVSLDRARSAGRHISFLKEKVDIDVAEDWLEYLNAPQAPAEMKQIR